MGLIPFLLPASLVISRNLCLDLNPQRRVKVRPHPRPTPRGGNRPHTTVRRGRESCSREKERPASGSATKTFIHSHEELGPTAAGTSVPGKRKPVLSTSGDKGPALARRLCVQGTLDKRGAEVLVRRLRSTYSEDAPPQDTGGHRGKRGHSHRLRPPPQETNRKQSGNHHRLNDTSHLQRHRDQLRGPCPGPQRAVPRAWSQLASSRRAGRALRASTRPRAHLSGPGPGPGPGMRPSARRTALQTAVGFHEVPTPK